MSLWYLLFLQGLLLTSVAYASVCVNGVCQMCTSSDSEKPYCVDTGRKMQVTCGKEETWESCVATPADEQMAVVLFQLAMGAIGGVAYWGLQIKKTKSLSLFEYELVHN